MAKAYRMKDGRTAFVAFQQDGYERYYATFIKRPGCGKYRKWSRSLPKRTTRAEAERDLEKVARINGWPEAQYADPEGENPIKLIRWESGDVEIFSGSFEELETYAKEQGQDYASIS